MKVVVSLLVLLAAKSTNLGNRALLNAEDNYWLKAMDICELGTQRGLSTF